MTKFSKQALEKIEAAVKAAESSTSGEIVPMVIASSGDYSRVGHRLGMVGLILGCAVSYFLHVRLPFLDYFFLLGVQGLGWVLGWSIGQIPAVIRTFLPQNFLRDEVHEAALASFLGQGLHNTEARTGILIFISLLERRVEILADKGIHEKVGEGYWKQEVDKLIAGFQKGHGSDSLVDVIGEIGAKLSQFFPRLAGDRNELSDELRQR